MLPYIHHLYDDLFVVDQEICKLQEVPKCITWNVSEKINSKDNVYIQILSQEDNIKDFFPDNEYYSMIISHLEVMKKTGIILNTKCFWRGVADSLIIDYFNEFNHYTATQLSSLETAIDYGNVIDTFNLINYIQEHPLKLRGQLKNHNPYLKFSPFTKTGRLRTCAPFFPIYNLEKSLRIDILPKNDYILEIDYNAAEFRIFLSLLGQPQPEDDAYLEVQKLFQLDSRDEAKHRVFEIIYSNYFKNSNISSILEKYVDNTNNLLTPYGNKIYLDDINKTINYLCQSTCSLLIYEKSLECIEYLKSIGSKSRILFPFHDAIIFDLHKDDIHKIRILKEKISNTRFGLFKNRAKIGTNYGNLQEII